VKRKERLKEVGWSASAKEWWAVKRAGNRPKENGSKERGMKKKKKPGRLTSKGGYHSNLFEGRLREV